MDGILDMISKIILFGFLFYIAWLLERIEEVIKKQNDKISIEIEILKSNLNSINNNIEKQYKKIDNDN